MRGKKSQGNKIMYPTRSYKNTTAERTEGGQDYE